jgi:hypothetical protein
MDSKLQSLSSCKTSNLRNLTPKQPYEGPHDIVIGDDPCLNITHIDNYIISSSSHNFSLTNVLYVTFIQQNLVFVSQFCKTKNTFIEFFSQSFWAKDLTTGSPLF